LFKVAKLLKKKEFSFLKTVHNFCNLKNAPNRHSLVSMRNCELKVKILMKRKTKSWTGSSTFKVNGSVCVALVSFFLFFFLFVFVSFYEYVGSIHHILLASLAHPTHTSIKLSVIMYKIIIKIWELHHPI